jgi:hypothetical protein
MKIPNFIDTPIVDKDGNLTLTWKQIIQQLITQLQLGLSDEGILVPQQTAGNIAKLTGDKVIGSLIYDSDNNLLKVNINDSWKTVLTS